MIFFNFLLSKIISFKRIFLYNGKKVEKAKDYELKVIIKKKRIFFNSYELQK